MVHKVNTRQFKSKFYNVLEVSCEPGSLGSKEEELERMLVMARQIKRISGLDSSVRRYVRDT
jgi:hypothetical protein